MATRLRRVLPVALIALLLSLGSSGTASAHAAYKDSDPAEESTISNAPTSVWAEFTEPLSDASTLKIYDPCGMQVDAGDVAISGYRMTVSMSSERRGEFTVRFVANSSLDGHTTSGEFTFTTTSGELCASTEEEADAQKETTSNDSEEQQDPVVSDAPDTSSDEVASTQTQGSRSHKHHSHGQSDSGGRGRGKGGGKQKDITLTADEGPPSPKAPSLFGDMPWRSFGLALLFALVIGAAGGKVYAGIMGPRA